MKKALITGITGQDGSYLAEIFFPLTTESSVFPLITMFYPDNYFFTEN